MTQIGNVPEIVAVKKQLNDLKKQGLVKEWELPYENLLTRITAAKFFLTPNVSANTDAIWKKLGENNALNFRPNDEKKLSQLEWQFEFNKE